MRKLLIFYASHMVFLVRIQCLLHCRRQFLGLNSRNVRRIFQLLSIRHLSWHQRMSASLRSIETTIVRTPSWQRWPVAIVTVTITDQLVTDVCCDSLGWCGHTARVEEYTSIRGVRWVRHCFIARRRFTRRGPARLPHCQGMHGLRHTLTQCV